MFSPDRARLLGRIGGYVTAATHDGREITATARAAFLARFEREVDPEGVLPPEERTRRAFCARRAYFCRLARRSAQARRAKRATADSVAAARVETGRAR